MGGRYTATTGPGAKTSRAIFLQMRPSQQGPGGTKWAHQSLLPRSAATLIRAAETPSDGRGRDRSNRLRRALGLPRLTPHDGQGSVHGRDALVVRWLFWCAVVRRPSATRSRVWTVQRRVPLSLSGVESPTHSSVTVSLKLRRARRTSTAPSVACSSLRQKPGEQLLCCSHTLHS